MNRQSGGYSPDPPTAPNPTAPRGGTGEVNPGLLTILKRKDGTELPVVAVDALAQGLYNLGIASMRRANDEPRRSFKEQCYREALNDVCTIIGIRVGPAPKQATALEALKASVGGEDAADSV